MVSRGLPIFFLTSLTFSYSDLICDEAMPPLDDGDNMVTLRHLSFNIKQKIYSI